MMPLIPAAIAMAVGIILSAVAGPVGCGVTALAAAIAMMALRRNYVAIILCAAAAGALAYGVSAPADERLPYGEPVTLEADIRETRDGDATRRLLAQPLIYTDTAGLTHRLVNTGAIYLYLPSIEPDIEAGDRIVVHTCIDRARAADLFP